MPARPRSASSERARNQRGSSYDRARRRSWLLATFNPELGPTRAVCTLNLVPECLGTVDADTLSVDRIVPGGPYTHDNIKPACTPCQNHQGGQIGTERRRRTDGSSTRADAPLW